MKTHLQSRITSFDFIASLLALSHKRSFPADRTWLSSALRVALNAEEYPTLPRLTFRLIADIVYCDELGHALDLLALSGMIRFDNPWFASYFVSEDLETYFSQVIEPKLSQEQTRLAKRIATRIWGES
jgi:hypothetical protein